MLFPLYCERLALAALYGQFNIEHFSTTRASDFHFGNSRLHALLGGGTERKNLIGEPLLEINTGGKAINRHLPFFF